MKLSVLFISVVMAIPFGISAQNADCQDQMVAAFGDEKYNSLVAENAVEADFQCFKNTNGYYITDLPPGKSADSFPNLFALESLNEDIFPALNVDSLSDGIFLAGYGIEVKPKHYGYYSLGDSDQLFVVYPQSLIRTLFEKQ